MEGARPIFAPMTHASNKYVLQLIVPENHALIYHRWLDERMSGGMRVTGCAELNAWTEAKNPQIGVIRASTVTK